MNKKIFWFIVLFPIRQACLIVILIGLYMSFIYNGDKKYIFQGDITSYNYDCVYNKTDINNKEDVYKIKYKDLEGVNFEYHYKTARGKTDKFIVDNIKNKKLYTRNKFTNFDVWFGILIIVFFSKLVIIFTLSIPLDCNNYIVSCFVALWIFFDDSYEEIFECNLKFETKLLFEKIGYDFKKFFGYEEKYGK